jgi:hypothetical protein
MGDTGGDIIIKGGSVELIFAESLYSRTADPSLYQCPGRKITRIVITGDIEFDSGDYPEGLRCEVKAITAQVA